MGGVLVMSLVGGFGLVAYDMQLAHVSHLLLM